MTMSLPVGLLTIKVEYSDSTANIYNIGTSYVQVNKNIFCIFKLFSFRLENTENSMSSNGILNEN